MNKFLGLLVVSLVLVSGCSDGDETLANKAGAKVGQTATDFLSGVGKGIDKQMTVKVELSKELTDRGVTMTIAKAGGLDPTIETDRTVKNISVYLISSKPFASELIAKALTKEGQEIGRAIGDVDLAADDAKYVVFQFNHEMDSQLVEKYLVDIKKTPSATHAAPAAPAP